MKYTVQPLSLELAPFDARLAQLLQKVPADFAEAEKISADIKQLRERILSETVTPAPKPGHSVKLYHAVMALTKQVMVEAGLFRDQHGDSAKDGSAGVAAASAP